MSVAAEIFRLRVTLLDCKPAIWREVEVASIMNPRCLAGERSGPPEDCGGPPACEALLIARTNPRSKRARELIDWAGPGWNPEAFDVALINKALAALPAPRRLH